MLEETLRRLPVRSDREQGHSRGTNEDSLRPGHFRCIPFSQLPDQPGWVSTITQFSPLSIT